MSARINRTVREKQSANALEQAAFGFGELMQRPHLECRQSKGETTDDVFYLRRRSANADLHEADACAQTGQFLRQR